ncbi:MAG TPA: ATP-binding cassette domain-containing protein [Bacteroidales bacterium]|nr:ATP-binding cassette domain-containing protein [Bacteroidales bacterium]
MELIQVEQLSKRFSDLVAVDRVNFAIKEGEIFGFLGPNGAGKTTTLSILSTLLKPSSGKARVNGYDVETQKSQVRQSIGVVFQDPTLDEELTARENMDIHGRLYGMKHRREKIDALLRLVELDNRKDQLVKQFSGGMKRRLEIARGLLHEPRILFLDEPTLGLDPQTRNHLWDYIRELNQQKGVTIILTTHYMDEAEKLSDRVAIIDHGRIIALDTPKALVEQLGGSMIRIESSESGKVSEKLSSLSWLSNLNAHNGYVDVTLHNAEKRIAEVIKVLNDVAIESVSLQIPTLEDVFLSYTGRTIREQEASSKDRIRQRRKATRR